MWIKRLPIVSATWRHQAEAMTASEHLVNAAIAAQARGWFVAHDEGPLGAQETAAFLTWLRASPVHVRAFLRVSRIARDLKAAAEGPDFALEALLEEARTDTGNHVVEIGSPNVQGGRAIARRPGKDVKQVSSQRRSYRDEPVAEERDAPFVRTRRRRADRLADIPHHCR